MNACRRCGHPYNQHTDAWYGCIAPSCGCSTYLAPRTKISIGDATVSFGKPLYGKERIIANAPLTYSGFTELIAALSEAQHRYLNEK